MAAFGESRMFPAFFSSQSGFQAPYRVQDEEEAAKLIGVFQQGKAHVGPGTEGQKVESFFVVCLLLLLLLLFLRKSLLLIVQTASKVIGGYKPLASWTRTCPWLS